MNFLKRSSFQSKDQVVFDLNSSIINLFFCCLLFFSRLPCCASTSGKLLMILNWGGDDYSWQRDPTR